MYRPSPTPKKSCAPTPAGPVVYTLLAPDAARQEALDQLRRLRAERKSR